MSEIVQIPAHVMAELRQAEIDALREQNRVLREALQEIYEGRWTPGVSCCYEDDARSIYPTREMRIRSIAQVALTATSQPVRQKRSYSHHPAFDEYGEHR